MAASVYHVISKEVEITSLDTIQFLDMHVWCINNPYWQSSGIIIFFCICYIVISDTVGGSFLDVLSIPRRNKDLVIQKSTMKNLWERHHFFDWMDSKSFFVAFFVYSLYLHIPKAGILRDDIMSELWKIRESLAI